jgi:hypothetical protein
MPYQYALRLILGLVLIKSGLSAEIVLGGLCLILLPLTKTEDNAPQLPHLKVHRIHDVDDDKKELP